MKKEGNIITADPIFIKKQNIFKEFIKVFEKEATKYEDLKYFIKHNLKKYMIYKEVMHILDLKDIFKP